ncbi:MAG: phage terminase large subunit family protein [Desulfobulbaceae bacterium]|nr:phage terminase large subunit family protein [Desulfobulbaceae bacterium]
MRCRFVLSPGERRIFRRRAPISPSAWATKNRIITYGPMEGALYSHQFMPHMRGIMDASFFPSVRMIGNCKAPQTGSSSGCETMLGYIADRQPGPALVVYPDRDTASKRSKNYLQPMFEKSPTLARLMTGIEDDMTALQIKLQTMLIHMGWSGSATSLGNISAKYLIGDELDKWDESPSKKEASSYMLFLERYRAYKYGAKCWLISTPTVESGFIWRYMNDEAEAVFEYAVACPHCKAVHPLHFDQVVVGGVDAGDGKAIMAAEAGRYLCPECQVAWTDRERVRALWDGIWLFRPPTGGAEGKQIALFDYLDQFSPSKICFHSHALVTPLVSLSEIAAARSDAAKNPDKARYYDTQMLAIAHIPQHRARREDHILRLRDEALPKKVVPADTSCIILLVDTQKIGFYYQIWAFQFGQELPCAIIEQGFLESFANLRDLAQGEYLDAIGAKYNILAAFIDSGGGADPAHPRHSRTAEVYEFCRQNPQFKPLKGRRQMERNWNISRIDYYPGRAKAIPIPGGLNLYKISVTHYKNELAGKLEREPDAPGSLRLHAEIGAEYATQMCAEYQDERGWWLCPPGRANHHWDLGVYALAAADIVGVRGFLKPTTSVQGGRRVFSGGLR